MSQNKDKSDFPYGQTLALIGLVAFLSTATYFYFQQNQKQPTLALQTETIPEQKEVLVENFGLNWRKGNQKQQKTSEQDSQQNYEQNYQSNHESEGVENFQTVEKFGSFQIDREQLEMIQKHNQQKLNKKLIEENSRIDLKTGERIFNERPKQNEEEKRLVDQYIFDNQQYIKQMKQQKEDEEYFNIKKRIETQNILENIIDTEQIKKHQEEFERQKQEQLEKIKNQQSFDKFSQLYVNSIKRAQDNKEYQELKDKIDEFTKNNDVDEQTMFFLTRKLKDFEDKIERAQLYNPDNLFEKKQIETVQDLYLPNISIREQLIQNQQQKKIQQLKQLKIQQEQNNFNQLMNKKSLTSPLVRLPEVDKSSPYYQQYKEMLKEQQYQQNFFNKLNI